MKFWLPLWSFQGFYDLLVNNYWQYQLHKLHSYWIKTLISNQWCWSILNSMEISASEVTIWKNFTSAILQLNLISMELIIQGTEIESLELFISKIWIKFLNFHELIQKIWFLNSSKNHMEAIGAYNKISFSNMLSS